MVLRTNSKTPFNSFHSTYSQTGRVGRFQPIEYSLKVLPCFHECIAPSHISISAALSWTLQSQCFSQWPENESFPPVKNSQKWSIVKTTWLIVVNGLMILLRPTNVKYTLSSFKNTLNKHLHRARWSWQENFQSFDSQMIENSSPQSRCQSRRVPRWPITGISASVSNFGPLRIFNRLGIETLKVFEPRSPRAIEDLLISTIFL